jgi:predicted metal-dependent peptidase
MTLSLEDRIIKSRINLLRNSPFFGTLLLNAPYKFLGSEDGVLTAATDGQTLYMNKEYMSELSDPEFCGVLTHEVLHMALEHVDRLKAAFREDEELANIAADIVVNGICRANNVPLPSHAIFDHELEHLSAIEIYSILRARKNKMGSGKKGDKKVSSKSPNRCLQPDLKSTQGGDKGEAGADEGGNGDKKSSKSNQFQKPAKTNWKDVMNKAMTIARSKNAGSLGAGLKRIFKEFLEPTINWRDALYKYITDSRTDFEAFDRRFIHQGSYFDDLGGGKIHVMVFMDTSASVDEKLLGEFIAELRFAVNALPQITGDMWYFDTKLYPFGDIKEIFDIPQITGGGGTSFHPAIELINKTAEEDSTVQTLGIIFTDGHASLSLPDPETNILWCISPGGLSDDKFPFGEVIRIVK